MCITSLHRSLMGSEMGMQHARLFRTAAGLCIAASVFACEQLDGADLFSTRAAEKMNAAWVPEEPQMDLVKSAPAPPRHLISRDVVGPVDLGPELPATVEEITATKSGANRSY